MEAFAAACSTARCSQWRTETAMAGRRRGHGEGSIYRRADGLWVGSVDLGWDLAGKRLRKTVSSRTQAGVIEKLREVGSAATDR